MPFQEVRGSPAVIRPSPSREREIRRDGKGGAKKALWNIDRCDLTRVPFSFPGTEAVLLFLLLLLVLFPPGAKEKTVALNYFLRDPMECRSAGESISTAPSGKSTTATSPACFSKSGLAPVSPRSFSNSGKNRFEKSAGTPRLFA